MFKDRQACPLRQSEAWEQSLFWETRRISTEIKNLQVQPKNKTRKLAVQKDLAELAYLILEQGSARQPPHQSSPYYLTKLEASKRKEAELKSMQDMRTLGNLRIGMHHSMLWTNAMDAPRDNFTPLPPQVLLSSSTRQQQIYRRNTDWRTNTRGVPKYPARCPTKGHPSWNPSNGMHHKTVRVGSNNYHRATTDSAHPTYMQLPHLSGRNNAFGPNHPNLPDHWCTPHINTQTPMSNHKLLSSDRSVTVGRFRDGCRPKRTCAPTILQDGSSTRRPVPADVERKMRATSLPKQLPGRRDTKQQQPQQHQVADYPPGTTTICNMTRRCKTQPTSGISHPLGRLRGSQHRHTAACNCPLN